MILKQIRRKDLIFFSTSLKTSNFFKVFEFVKISILLPMLKSRFEFFLA